VEHDNGISNPTDGLSFADILDQRISRRGLIAAGAGTAAVAFLGSGTGQAGAEGWGRGRRPVTFTPIPMAPIDGVVVPEGYQVEILARWGDPILGSFPAFLPDASNTSFDQEEQFGSHCDGMALYPISWNKGLLCVNHEYHDDALLHVGGLVPWTAEKVRKAQAAHGVSVVMVRKRHRKWSVVPSKYNRRISVLTPTEATGPAAGHPLLHTAADPTGTYIIGILNQCSSGPSPWGTYLTTEENWNGYFGNSNPSVPADQRRYGITAAGFGYRWPEHDTRFDANANPNEANRFGYVVEIDPFDPHCPPKKRTALGRIKREGATCVTASDGRVVVYSGDDEQFEYIYKFVSAEPWKKMRRRGESPLDRGTLYVAKFEADGSGTWLPLVHDTGPLTEANGFPDQAAVCVRTRQAGDAVGATKMDRPEWIAHDDRTGMLYVTLTNNTRRGATGQPGTDAANPRAVNNYGHIIRWAETAGHTGTTFDWDIFILAGDPALGPDKAGTVVGDAFGSPDGIWTDPLGRLWVQTDASGSQLLGADYANLRANQMLVADVDTGVTKRFLTGPPNSEITGIAMAPDHKALFVGIQHPGESPTFVNDPANPTRYSSWPDGANRPRSSVIVVRRTDNGIIGD
jgi:secreted PhoX family phosphatase